MQAAKAGEGAEDAAQNADLHMNHALALFLLDRLAKRPPLILSLVTRHASLFNS